MHCAVGVKLCWCHISKLRWLRCGISKPKSKKKIYSPWRSDNVLWLGQHWPKVLHNVWVIGGVIWINVCWNDNFFRSECLKLSWAKDEAIDSSFFLGMKNVALKLSRLSDQVTKKGSQLLDFCSSSGWCYEIARALSV